MAGAFCMSTGAGKVELVHVERVAASGLAATSTASSGPALPSSLMVPPPATLVSKVKGNALLAEKSWTSI